MDAAEQAYEAARAEIARVKAKGGEYLSLGMIGNNLRHLRNLPEELKQLSQLKSLSIGPSRVSDCRVLAHLKGLKSVKISNTGIIDLAPLSTLFKLEVLDLSSTQITDISPLSALSNLRELDLSKTQVINIDAISGMEKLLSLYLEETNIVEITPLSFLEKLLELRLDGSKVVDLRPIAQLPNLESEYSFGVSFLDTSATLLDPHIARFANIKNHTDRTRQTLAYLRSLPPWPEPYTPAATPDGSPPKPIGGVPDAPPPDRMPRLLLTPDHRIDLDPVLPTDVELADPIRKRLYERLPKALDGLLRYSNRYPELDSPARALRDMIASPFEEADFLMMHLEIDALTDVKDGQASLSDADKLDVDCLTALAGVLRIAPPITMGHPDIDLLEERGREYQRSRIPESVADAESHIARGLENHELATARTQEFARRTALAGPTGRVAEIRRGFSKNTILIMFFIADQATDAALGHVFGSATVSAAQFLLLHKDAILATAPTWGHSGFAWTQYVMIRAQQIVDSANRNN
ncbi:MAG: hypothetical protein GVY34_12665 [Alphaproteobacteria bacterium]|jgi:hypothetical protein|nr:hypothetical protein [Alphaproteobacteria bacterium]